MNTMSVARKFEAERIKNPIPGVAATSSAATKVPQPTPMAMRRPVKISGNAEGEHDVKEHLTRAHAK